MNSMQESLGKSRRRWTGVLVFLGLLVNAPAYAQVGANVGGVVRDDSDAVLPGVTITVTNTATGTAQSLVTSDEGRYRAVALQPGPYEIAAELAGFGTLRRSIVLVVGAEATVDITLGVATLAENITVVGDAPLVEVARSQPSSVVTSEQLEALPVLNRNFIVLAQLLPGAGPARPGGLFPTTKFGGVGDQRFGYVTYVDGGDLHDPFCGHPTINLSQDSVAEFKVFRNQFDAEYGAALTAIVSVVTKAGTNSLSGSGFYFGRHDTLNARNAFARVKPPFEQARFGGSFGGPIAQNRTHFFIGYEQQETNSAEITALPSTNPFAALENGVYPNLRTDQNFSARVDHRFNEAHSLYARYAFGDWLLNEGTRPVRIVGGLELGALKEIQTGTANSSLVEEKWILSDSKLNTLRVHILDNNLSGEPLYFGLRVQRPSFSWGQVHRDPQKLPSTKYTVSDTLFVTGRGHDLKVGGEFIWADQRFDAHHYENGNFIFNTDAPFDANNPATWPLSFEQRQAGFLRFTSSVFAGFVQDTWRLGNAVNLNLGLRYDFETGLRDNETHEALLKNPTFKGLEQFRGGDRSTDYDNFQPRLGITWNVRGDGTLVGRAGWGYYIARNEAWYTVSSQQVNLNTVFITDPQRLRFFPDITAVRGGLSLEQASATGGARAVAILGTQYGRPRQETSTAGVSWQVTGTTSLDADYVRGQGARQLTAVDRNLPEWGPISPSNPRPVATLSRVVAQEMIAKSSYDALEMQFRQRVRGANSLQVSYTLSRTLVDLSNGTLRSTFFNNVGYHPDDTRHNLTASVSSALPWGLQLAGIARVISGYPKPADSGLDLDGDGVSGDRPPGLPVTVGRGNKAEQLRIINDFRAARGLSPFTEDVLELFPIKSIDVRATKSVSVGTRRLEVFLEAFNVFNFVSELGSAVALAPGGAAAGSNIRLATFGVPTAARDARQVQWGARFSF
jgi:hypothetical protein